MQREFGAKIKDVQVVDIEVWRVNLEKWLLEFGLWFVHFHKINMVEKENNWII
jgi:hypothetical protein